MDPREPIIRAFWRAFDRADFDAAATMMAHDSVVSWPCTGEVFRGRDNFIAVQKHYPGRWRIAVERIVMATQCVVSVVKVTPEDGTEPSFHATSFFELVGDTISGITEYWGTNEEPPEWRKKGGWAQREGRR